MTDFADHERTTEEWRWIAGFENRYEVSSLGRVRNSRTGHIKAQSLNHGGYSLVGLSAPGIKGRAYAVHALVADAFIGRLPKGYDRCHLNGVRTDNRVSNIIIATRKENHSHKYLHGTEQTGVRHHAVKLTEEQVRDIRERAKTRINKRAVARELGVSTFAIYAIVKGLTWRHIL